MAREADGADFIPIPGRWLCGHCRRSLEVVTEGEKPAVSAFVCVCGTTMEPINADDAAQTTSRPHEATPGIQRTELGREVREAQAAPIAGIWACDNCGRRIQVTEPSEHEKLQPYVCVCGVPMQPGEEHAVRESARSGVVDD
jgi:hypothetical protein